MPWWISLLVELLKLLIPVLKHHKEVPKEKRQEEVANFGGEVKGLLSKLKKRREGVVGEAPDLV